MNKVISINIFLRPVPLFFKHDLQKLCAYRNRLASQVRARKRIEIYAGLYYTGQKTACVKMLME